ncbi:MAG: META domain-containing protein [Rhodothermales bacterium]|nr:META domain-containing protein [Rhodothermales bacterium]
MSPTKRFSVMRLLVFAFVLMLVSCGKTNDQRRPESAIEPESAAGETHQQADGPEVADTAIPDGDARRGEQAGETEKQSIDAPAGDLSDANSNTAQSQTSTFRAAGNEPGWTLSFSETGLELYWNNGQNRTATTSATERATDRGFQIFAQTETHRIVVDVYKDICRDTMTGMPYPNTVSVAVDSRTMSGCGGDPSTLLEGIPWTVHTIANEQLVDVEQPSFLVEGGRISGRTPCNTFNATFQLSAEGLVAGNPAVTRMACPEGLTNVEAGFLYHLERVIGFDVDDAGDLTLKTGSEGTIVARREVTN